ncbi:MAG TPA: NADH-quinone oxidoreductase subunit B family protein [Anaerolineae bacterium]|nr:NADH-quinone oxidoreductase subunit B family protein [Anaerolineae bacterium]
MSDDIPEPVAIEVPEDLKGNVFLTRLSQVYGWGRKYSLWPMFFGVACCAIEFMAAGASRYDMGRFGMDLARASPRQADLIVISGTVTKKMITKIVALYNQMAEPKYVISMGACACGGGPFKEGYNVVSGVDTFLPVDLYIPGCPPTPEATLNAYILLHKKIQGERIDQVRWYRKEAVPEVPVPMIGGPDLVDVRRIAEISAAAGEGSLEDSS